MAELRESHLRYLLVIYELGRIKPDVGTQDIAKTLNCSKAFVTKMMGILMDLKLLVRERYGKIYLTDTGFLLAKDLLRCIELIRERLPAIGLDLTEEEAEEYIRMMAMNCRSIAVNDWQAEHNGAANNPASLRPLRLQTV